VRCNHLTPEELEYEIDGSDWADAWECSESPQARAYSLLKELNLGCSMDQEGKKEGRVEFIEGGWHPGSSECWVELRNDLTVSLLQAHIIERDLPIKITFDEAGGDLDLYGPRPEPCADFSGKSAILAWQRFNDSGGASL